MTSGRRSRRPSHSATRHGSQKQLFGVGEQVKAGAGVSIAVAKSEFCSNLGSLTIITSPVSLPVGVLEFSPEMQRASARGLLDCGRAAPTYLPGPTDCNFGSWDVEAMDSSDLRALQ